MQSAYLWQEWNKRICPIACLQDSLSDDLLLWPDQAECCSRVLNEVDTAPCSYALYVSLHLQERIEIYREVDKDAGIERTDDIERKWCAFNCSSERVVSGTLN